MTIQEINALLIDSYWEILTYRLLPTLTPDKMEMQGNKYTDIMLNSTFTKPTLLEYEAEFVIYKQELVDQENARLAEVARVEDIKSRYSILEPYIHSLKIGSTLADQPNPAIILRELTKPEKLIDLELMESKYPSLLAASQKKQIRADKKVIGNKQKAACEECLAIIRGDNNGKTDADIDSMLTTFAPIYAALIQHRPNKVRTLVEAVPNDGIIDILKQELLEELAEHGF